MPERYSLPDTGKFEALRITLSETDYLVPVESTGTVVDVPSTVRVPRSSAGVRGVTDIRGEVTTIITPHPYVHTVGDPAEDAELLLLSPSVDPQPVGMVVCSVGSVETHDVSTVTDRDSLSTFDTPGIDNNALHGVVHGEDSGSDGLTVNPESTESTGIIDVRGLLDAVKERGEAPAEA